MQTGVPNNLRKIADNLDVLADHELRHNHHKYVPPIRNNAAYLRRAADIIINLENAMGKFADKIHAVEKERDDARRDAAQGRQAQSTLDALTAAGRIADDADVAALTDDTTAGTDTTPGAGGGDVTPTPTPEPTPAP